MKDKRGILATEDSERYANSLFGYWRPAPKKPTSVELKLPASGLDWWREGTKKRKPVEAEPER